MPYGMRTIFEESVSAVTATPSVALGTRRCEGANEYVYVYNGGTTAAVGYGMIASAFSGYTCVVSAAAKDPCFGVVQNADLTTNYYGWLQTRGFVHVASVNALAAMDKLTLGANGSFEKAASAAADAQNAFVCGYAGTAIGSGATGTAYVNCL